MRVFGPDGREWTISRRPDPPGVLQSILPGGSWLVEATTSDETRCWRASSRSDSGSLVEDVALALRTGSEGPAGELPDDGSDLGSQDDAEA